MSTEVSTLSNTHYEEIANTLMQQLDQIAVAIPKLETGDRSGTVRFVRGHLNIPDDFLTTAVAALQQTQALQGTQLFDAAESRDTLQYLQAFQLFFNKLNSLRNIMAYTLWSKKASLATDALRIYGISKQIALKPGNIATAEHVSIMKQNLGKRGPKKASKQDGSDPKPPVTPPHTAS